MRNYLLAGVAVAAAFTILIPSAPASAQSGCGIGHACGGYRAAHAGPTQYRYPHRGYSHGYGRDNGIGVGAAALAAGVIIGGAMQQNQGYDDGYGYPVQTYPAGPYPAYPGQGALYDEGGALVANDGGSVAYCQQTYRSYDPASGTYLGYDGLRHPCP